MKYIFKINYLRNILIIALIIALGLPICVTTFIYPAFTELLTKNTEEEAIRVARHLNFIIIPEQNKLNKNSLPAELMSKIQEMTKGFKLMKLKIFSDSGKIIYSSTPTDIGQINNKRYFHDVVTWGKVYTKVVEKDAKSLENQTVTADVVETYVPIMKNDIFIGAFEI